MTAEIERHNSFPWRIGMLLSATAMAFLCTPCVWAAQMAEKAEFHSADTNADCAINLMELLRVVQFFNMSSYDCDITGKSADGYTPGSGTNRECALHDSDFDATPWKIALPELLRMIQFFGMQGYHCAALPGDSEDGFLPGPDAAGCSCDEEGEGEGEGVATAPVVSSNRPMNGAMGVPLGASLTAVFSEPMDPLTITGATFTLDQGITPVLGTVEYAGVTATFTPNDELLPNTAYTATVWMQAANLAGDTLPSDQVWTFTTGVATIQEPLDLGSTNTFAVLAGSTCASTGPTIINGDLGVSPGTAVDGFPPGVLNGNMFTGVDSDAGQAKLDLTTAFNEAAGRSTGSISLPGNLSGLTLYPGLYTNSTSVMLTTGNATLDANGDENAVFIFQMGSTLTTESGTQVVLSGNAKAANVYWQVGTSATLGTNSIFKGNILAGASITLATGAVLEGRALTQIGAVTLDAATITAPAP